MMTGEYLTKLAVKNKKECLCADAPRKSTFFLVILALLL